MSGIDSIRKRIALSKQQEQSRPQRTLSAKEKTREKRIRKLLERLAAGKDISRRDLQTALTDDGWLNYETLEETSVVAKAHEQRPKEFDRYLELLHRADFFQNRAVAMKDKLNPKRDEYGRTPRAAIYSRAESAYENALEELQDLLTCASPSARAELLSWLDRDADFDAGSKVGADTISVPRLRSSKSANTQSKVSKTNLFKQRRAHKKDVLE